MNKNQELANPKLIKDTFVDAEIELANPKLKVTFFDVEIELDYVKKI